MVTDFPRGSSNLLQGIGKHIFGRYKYVKNGDNETEQRMHRVEHEANNRDGDPLSCSCWLD